MSLLDVLTQSVTIPQWYLLAFSIGTGAFGVAIALVSSALGERMAIRRIERLSAVRVAGATTDVKQGTKAKGKGKETSSPVPVRVTAEGYRDLEARIARRAAYKIGEVANLLNVTSEDVMRWVHRGELATFVVGDARWVAPRAVVKLMDKVGATAVTSVAKESQVLEPSAVPAVEPERKRYPLPVRQFYKYSIAGVKGQFATLREALSAAGYKVKEGQTPDWGKLPPDVRDRITRERI